MARHPGAAQAVVDRIAVFLPDRISGLVSRLAATFILGLVPLKSARAIAMLFFLSVPIWLFEAGLFYMIAISFDLQDPIGGHGNLMVAAVLVTAVANIGASVPAAPGGIGLFELIARETLVLLPLGMIDRAVAGGYVAVVHAALLLPMIPSTHALYPMNLSQSSPNPCERPRPPVWVTLSSDGRIMMRAVSSPWPAVLCTARAARRR